MADAQAHGATGVGASYDGYRLSSVTLERFEFEYAAEPIGPPTADAYRFVYEHLDRAANVELVQSRDPRTLQWLGIVPPSGTVDLFENSARLAHDGLYTTITAPDPKAALAIARAVAQRR